MSDSKETDLTEKSNRYNLRSKVQPEDEPFNVEEHEKGAENRFQNRRVERCQQPPVYVNTNLMKIKMEVDYIPIKAEPKDDDSTTTDSIISLQSSSLSFRSHNQESIKELRKFKCKHPACKYAAKTLDHLKVHSNIHKSKNIVCKHKGCYYRTNQKDNLARHLKIHSERKHRCAQCLFTCHQHSKLVSHMRVHTGERPFSCQLCIYKGKTSTHLKNHKKNKHFPLQKSDKRASGGELLAEKSFKCQVDGCKFSSADSKSLAQHYNTHNLPKVVIKKLNM